MKEIIKKEGSKPFDPVECGFELTRASQYIYDEDPDFNVLEYVLKSDEEYLIRYFKYGFCIGLMQQKILKC